MKGSPPKYGSPLLPLVQNYAIEEIDGGAIGDGVTLRVLPLELEEPNVLAVFEERLERGWKGFPPR